MYFNVVSIHISCPNLATTKDDHGLLSRLALDGKCQRIDLMVYDELGPIKSS